MADKGKKAAGTMDYTIYLVVVILVAIGVVMVFSASYLFTGRRAFFNYDAFFYLKRGGVLAVIGFLVMNLMANFPYQKLMRLAKPMYGIAVVLLLAVFVFGKATNGSTRWIPLPIIGQFQPSEVAKVALIMILAYTIDKHKNILVTWKGFIQCSLLVGVVAVAVVIGNLSTAIIICIIGFGIIFIASPYIMRFVVIGGTGAGTLVGGLMFMAANNSDNFRAGRFMAWIDPFSDQSRYGFQIINSLYAVASGGMFGLGIGQSRQKTFLPEAHNDIIFSIICEELGFVGASIVLLLFGILIWRGIRVAINAPDIFGSLMAGGIVLLIASQVIINVAVVTNSIVNTGIPLPFISYGGTALIVCMGLIGILLNISRHVKQG